MAPVWLLLGIASSTLRICQAIPWIGAMETPIGMMAAAGMSPRPTEAPGLKGLPKELMPRQNNVQYPPPDNWCGFVDGVYSNPLSCSAQLTCINSGTAVGCCSGLDSACTALFTTCVNYGDPCNANCLRDTHILSCFEQLPYCGTYSFSGSNYMYNCQTSAQILVDSVEYLADYYLTAIGSTLTTFASTSNSFLSAEAASTSGAPGRTGNSASKSTSTLSPSPSDHASTGLASAAIGGIAAGAGVVICAVLGFIIWFCLRRRKRARLAASQQITNHAPPTFNPQQTPPPMQQQPQTAYQAVPQQDPSFQGNNQYQPTQSGYYGGPTNPGKDNVTLTHVSPIGTPSPSKVEPVARPFSITSSQHPSEGGQNPQSLSPPLPGYAGPLANGATQDYYSQPTSPNVTEVDGTQGNPGVPHGQRPALNEVDGTQGNPGVPHSQHHYQGPYEMH